MTSGYGAQEIEDGGGVSFAEEIARKKRRVSLSNATDELTQYLSEPPAPIPTDVLEWRKVNSTRYPRLSVMAGISWLCSRPQWRLKICFAVKVMDAGRIKLKCKSDEIDYERVMEMAGATTAENTAGLDKKQR
ncbi:hypothetical protein NC653_028466 [Populus alba x Populus x berolinensis]|uniref:HAT C-terminal dimerisation domain-containing protein n=1 Tax=Populus alba x Populus x berolinensis TaxID=444605 RepID=A0AAD6M2M8_9ROSI|nr:hypothetical protein NC653_028466 [Populus alba x Populus x berolinensis]